MVIHIADLSSLPATLEALRVQTPGVSGEAGVVSSEFPARMSESAVRIKRLISEESNQHCSTVRDAIYILKKQYPAKSKLLKQLDQLNAADAFFRHGSMRMLRQMEEEVSSALAAGMKVSDSELDIIVGPDQNNDSRVNDEFIVEGIPEMPSESTGEGMYLSTLPAQSSMALKLQTVEADFALLQERLARLEGFLHEAPLPHFQKIDDAIVQWSTYSMSSTSSPSTPKISFKDVLFTHLN